MQYLLDTHVLLWLTTDSPSLSPAARRIILSSASELYLSKVSIWEIAIKSSLRKLDLGMGMREFMQTHVLPNRIVIMDLKIDHIYAVEKLEFLHRDPFDRLLVAQSLMEKMPIVTNDAHIARYPVKTVY